MPLIKIKVEAVLINNTQSICNRRTLSHERTEKGHVENEKNRVKVSFRTINYNNDPRAGQCQLIVTNIINTFFSFAPWMFMTKDCTCVQRNRDARARVPFEKRTRVPFEKGIKGIGFFSSFCMGYLLNRY